MKRHISIFAGILLMMSAASCDFLETKVESNITTNNFFQSTSDFDMALTGVYYTFGSTEWAAQHRYGNYFLGFLYWGRIGTDEAFIAAGSNNGEDMIGNYTYTPENLFVEKVWFMQYLGIQRANIVIDRLNAYVGSGVSDADRSRILGEAHFLRAWFYFQLARYYGEVPLVLNETTDLSKLNTKKASLAEVYAQVISDYEKAESLLPETTTVGHAYKLAATALKARAYLQMAGEPLKDPQAAAKAVEACKTVINSGRFALVNDYFSQFDGMHEHNSEYIFDVEFDNTVSNNRYGGQVGTNEGLPNTEKLYTTQIRTFPDMYDRWDDNDLRKGSINKEGYIVTQNGVGKIIYNDPVTGEVTYERSYFIYKFRHSLDKSVRGSNWVEWNNAINFPIIRYADVLLMLPEAEYRANGTVSAEAWEGLNQVRRRGYGKPVNTPDPTVDLVQGNLTYANPYGDLEPVLAQILDERHWELAFEGHRWADLVRFGHLQQAFHDVLLHDDFWTQYYDPYRNNCKEKHSIFPVPQSVIDASDGAIEQNPLWK